MKKWFSTTLLSSTLALSSAVAFAGGPDIQDSRNATYININSGFSLNIVQLSAQYNNLTGNTSELFNTTGYDSAILLGFKVGHQWQLSQSNDLFLEAGTWYNWGNVRQTWHTDDVLAPGGQPFDLVNTIKPRLQMNLDLGVAHYLNDSLSVHINGGPSVLQAKSYYNTYGGTAAARNLEGPSQSETKYFWGGNLGLGFDLWLSAHSVIDCSVNDYVYASRKLKAVDNVDNTTPTDDNLTDRKVFITVPTLTIGYSYYF